MDREIQTCMTGEGMEEFAESERCKKCGMEVYPFSKKYSVSSGDYFCIKCAEKADRDYLIKNSCSVCKRLLDRGEVKIVMPSKIYGAERMPVIDRLICMGCYRRMGSRSMDRRSFRHKISQIRLGIRKGFAKRAMQRQPSQT